MPQLHFAELPRAMPQAPPTNMVKNHGDGKSATVVECVVFWKDFLEDMICTERH